MVFLSLSAQTSFCWEQSGDVAKFRQFFQSTINPNCSSHIFLWKQTFVDVSLFKTKLRAKIFLKKMIMSFVTWDEKGFLYQWLRTYPIFKRS